MEEKKLRPHCPYCYDGEVYEDKRVGGVYFCGACMREVLIQKFTR